MYAIIAFIMVRTIVWKSDSRYYRWKRSVDISHHLKLDHCDDDDDDGQWLDWTGLPWHAPCTAVDVYQNDIYQWTTSAKTFSLNNSAIAIVSDSVIVRYYCRLNSSTGISKHHWLDETQEVCTFNFIPASISIECVMLVECRSCWRAG